MDFILILKSGENVAMSVEPMPVTASAKTVVKALIEGFVGLGGWVTTDSGIAVRASEIAAVLSA